jgi:hypothetical protein
MLHMAHRVVLDTMQSIVLYIERCNLLDRKRHRRRHTTGIPPRDTHNKSTRASHAVTTHSGSRRHAAVLDASGTQRIRHRVGTVLT